MYENIFIGLCALGLFAGLTLKTAAQSITITVGPATDDSYWVWNDEYQCWIWNGPEFQGDYQGHPYSYWHGRHHEEWGRDHRPGKDESSEGERPVNKGDVEQPRAEQPKAEVEGPNAEQHKAEAEKPKAEEKAKTEKPKEEEKSKKEKPKPEEKKDDSKPKGMYGTDPSCPKNRPLGTRPLSVNEPTNRRSKRGLEKSIDCHRIIARKFRCVGG